MPETAGWALRSLRGLVSLTPVPTLDELAADPPKAAALPPEVARVLTLRCAAVLTALASAPRADQQPRQAMENEGWFTIPEVAARLRFAKSYVYQLVRRGDLPALRKGKYWRVRLADLCRWEAALSKDPLDGRFSKVLTSSGDRRRVPTAPSSASADPGATRRAPPRSSNHALPTGAGPGAYPRSRSPIDPTLGSDGLKGGP